MSLSKFYSNLKTVKTEGDQDQIEEVFKMMKEGDEKIELNPDFMSPTIVLGNTGSGKSSLILFVATDNTTLRSKESNEGSNDFFIVDDNEKIGSGINSQTSIPELVVDQDNQEAFYDCPGFNDTRTSVNEIATSYFIKTIFDFATEMKILLTVNYSSVRKGIDRADFMALMRNTTTLIKDIDKYEKSIGLVATKVENSYKKVNGQYELVPDENVLNGIVSFLDEAKQGIKDKLELVKGDVKEEIFLRNAEKLIEKLLITDGSGKFAKIGIFRRPDEAGPLLEVELLQERKPAMKKLIYQTLEFTKKNIDDIGYTLSDTAKLEITKMLEKIKSHVAMEVEKIVQVIGEHYQVVKEQLLSFLKLFGSGKDTDADVAHANDLLSKLNTIADAILKLNSDVVNATQIEEIADAIAVCGTTVSLDTVTSVEILKQQHKYFDFLQQVNGGLSIGDYSKNFDGILINVAAKLDVNKSVENIKNIVSAQIDNAVKEFEKHDQKIKEQILEHLKSFGKDSNAEADEVQAKDLQVKLTSSLDAITKLKSDVVKATKIGNIVEAVKTCSAELDTDNQVAIQNLLEQAKYFEVLQAINKDIINIGDYSKNFDGILVTLLATRKEIEKDVESMANSVKERIKVNLNDIVNELKSCYDTKFEPLGIKDLIVELGKQQKIMAQFLLNNKQISSVKALSKEICNMVLEAGIVSTTINASSMALLHYGFYLSFLNILKKELSVWSSDWIIPLNDPAQYIQVSEKWYNFLQRLYKQLSSYDYFGSSECYDVANLDHWALEGYPRGIHITKANYKQFMAKLHEKDEVVKAINPDEKKLTELNRLLELTIKQKINYEMKDNGELVIQAVLIKFSEIADTNGKLRPELSNGKTVKTINIFATDTVYFDEDLSAVGEKLKVNIVAPKWEIFGKRTINLNGANAAAIANQASNATELGGRGDDGKPGLPGGAGGNFVGVCYEFKAIETLTITANGGRGGDGQKGGNGKDGANGADADHSDDFHSEIYDTSNWGGLTRNWYKFFGKNGGKGGNGGNGGSGGIGGFPGDVQFIRKDDGKKLATIETDAGSNGAGGDGGSGASGGKQGNDLKIPKVSSLGGSSWEDWKKEVVSRSEHASNGKSGTAGQNTSGRQEPEKLEPVIIGDAVNNFESYIRKDLHERFLKQSLKQFLERLNHDTNEIYDTKILADTLSNLEGQLVKLANILTSDEIIYLYQSIAERTISYTEKPKKSEATTEHKNALNYIYTAALSQIKFRKASLAPHLIIDVAGYLDVVLKNVDELQKLTDKNSKLEVVNKAKKDFKSNVDKKIAEARKFVQTDILPEINAISSKLEEQIDKLLKEIKELQEAAELNKKRWLELKGQLEGALIMNGIFSGFKMFGQFLGPMGKIGEVATSIIDTSLAPPYPHVHPPPSFYSRSDATTSENIQAQITDTKDQIKKDKFRKPDVSVTADFTKRYKGDKEVFKIVNEAIQKAEEKLKRLKEFEQDVYDKMIPMLDGVEKNLDKISGQLKSESQVALDVTKWNIQSTLRDLKLQMKQATAGYKVEADIARCIEKLEETMTVQINLYDRMQSYEDQQILANYIAIVSTGTDESNPELSQALRTLEIMMRNNLILEQHKQAVNAFSQHVFPFANLYLNENVSQLPHPVTDEGLKHLASQAAAKVKGMQQKLDEYKVTITKQDEFITKSHFNSDFVSTRPFYVWDNENYKRIISKLLAGEKVALYTDIQRASTNKYAIKFSLSEIHLKAVDEGKQKDLDTLLKYFGAYITHLGNSYYRFQDRIYVIHSESETIHFTFEKAVDGTPTKTNGVYNKIRSGDLMLSPYAMWEIQLAYAEDESVDHFIKLKEFANQVDLELVGEGNYVSKLVDIPDLDVNSYYTPDTTTFVNKI